MKRVALSLAIYSLMLFSALADEPGRDVASLELSGGKVTIDYRFARSEGLAA